MHKFSQHWQQSNLLQRGHSFLQKKIQNTLSTFPVQQGIFQVHY